MSFALPYPGASDWDYALAQREAQLAAMATSSPDATCSAACDATQMVGLACGHAVQANASSPLVVAKA